MAKYRSAIIACGTIARCHARAWQSIPEVELSAIADTNPQALAEFGDFFGVPAEHRYTDFRAMLDQVPFAAPLINWQLSRHSRWKPYWPTLLATAGVPLLGLAIFIGSMVMTMPSCSRRRSPASK